MFKRNLIKSISTLNKLNNNSISNNNKYLSKIIVNNNNINNNSNNNISNNNNNKFNRNFTTNNNNASWEDLIKSDLIHDMKSFLTYKSQKGIELTTKQWLDILHLRGGKGLPSYMNLEVVNVKENGSVKINLKVGEHHLASNGYIHAASIICLADTACGYGCFTKLPKGSNGFTTIELKSNFLGTAKLGDLLECESTLIHAGKSTQVWDAIVKHGDKTLALFRCTEIVLYPQQNK